MSDLIKIHKSVLDSDFYREKRKFSRFEAWLDLLLNAGSSGEVELTIRELSRKWGWSRVKTQSYLNHLEKSHLLTKNQATNRPPLIIENWHTYSFSKAKKKPQKSQDPVGMELALKNNSYISKYSNISNDNKHITMTTAPGGRFGREFLEFWELSNKKGSKSKANIAFQNRTKEYSLGQIKQAWYQVLKEKRGTEFRFWPDISTFLNSDFEGYLDRSPKPDPSRYFSEADAIARKKELDEQYKIWKAKKHG